MFCQCNFLFAHAQFKIFYTHRNPSLFIMAPYVMFCQCNFLFNQISQ